jgi:hypothetical protein
VNRITHPKPTQASEHLDRDNVQWPLMGRAVLHIDEQAWAGTRFGPPAEQRDATPVVVTSDGDQPGTDQTRTPANRTKVAGARW